MSAHVCDGVDRAAALIEADDVGPLVRATMEAAFGGKRCECSRPILHGRDLMCGCCLRENAGQIEAYERAMREPHPFEEGRSKAAEELGMCGLCSMWRDDARHLPAPATPQQEAQ